MAFLNTVLSFLGETAAVTPSVTAPDKMWHLLILNVFDFIADYGWRIVVFTVLLKLVLSPLDFYQRYKLNKNQKITERLKPTMEKIQKQYGGDKQAFSQKQMELNRKEGYSYFSSCLPMIVTMVVFITLWLSMNTVAQYMTLKQYTTLYDEYEIAYEQVNGELSDPSKAKEVGQDVVFKMYFDGIDQEYVSELREKYGLSESFTLKNTDKVQASFLWIDNIWAPDVPWGSRAILNWDSFNSAINKYSGSDRNGLSSEQKSACLNKETYNNVMGKLLNDKSVNRTNGYLILPILVVLLSVASQLVSTMQQKKAGQVNAKGGVATSMKVMMFVMPVMMAVFAIQYASIFTLYMVVNSATTLFFNFTFTTIIRAVDKHKRNKNYGISMGSPRTISYKQSPIIHYVKGANPDAGKRESDIIAQNYDAGSDKSAPSAGPSKKDKKSKREKSAGTTTVVRGGRPDPNELMNYDMSSRDKKKK